MKKLVIINQDQFGYHNNTYYCCKYIKDDFDIIYICWDEGHPKIEITGVQVLYVSRKGSIPIRTIRLLYKALGQISGYQTIVFIKYFKGVSLLLRLLKPTYCFVLDIRTGSVKKGSVVHRRFYDAWMKLETRFFRHVTVISESLAEKLGIAHRAYILPLCADVLSSSNKTFDSLHLLYVGTLGNRNIDETLHGFKSFYDVYKDQIPVSYTIIGNGPNNEAKALKKLVAQYGLTDVVKITGQVPHIEIAPYFNICNVGVSYVPITDYFDCQPVTKTSEYLLSGMPVLATSTLENRKVIQSENGVLVKDTAEDFYTGLKVIFEKRHLFDSAKIRNNAMGYTCENIVRKNLKEYLKKISKAK